METRKILVAVKSRQEGRIFRTVKQPCVSTIKELDSITSLFTPIEMSNTKNEFLVNYGPWVTVQVKYNNVPLWGGRKLIIWEGTRMCGQGVQEKLVYLSLNLAANLKLLLKKSGAPVEQSVSV